MADWPTIASLATAGGTLVLAGATFASVRSANRAARAAERALLAGLRPLLLPTQLEDPPQKVTWVDRHFTSVGGGRAAVEVADDVIYLAAAVRNAGSGIAVLHGWRVLTGIATDIPPGRPEEFRRQTRDLYVPAAHNGFWQGAIREDGDPDRERVLEAIADRERITVEILYGDAEGGQRTITRFAFTPVDNGWLCGASRHWNLDRPDPR
jgi:hypothetical protein